MPLILLLTNRFILATKRDIELYHKDTEDGIYAKLYRDIEGIKDCSPYEIADTTDSAKKNLGTWGESDDVYGMMRSE